MIGEVDASGNVTYTAKYDVFGAVRSSSGTSTSKHKFCGSLGHSSENETGLIYMRARYYDPVTGRFISEDTAGQGSNWYLYCEDNPINLVDSTGAYPTLEEYTTEQIFSWIAEKFFISVGAVMMHRGMAAYGAGTTQSEGGRFLCYASDTFDPLLATALNMIGQAEQLEGSMKCKSGVKSVIAGAMMVLTGKLVEALGPDAAYYYKDCIRQIAQ